eukprot:Skav229399  [mRNA]  locus=scaffold2316:79349:82788:- [translate_table: standard]
MPRSKASLKETGIHTRWGIWGGFVSRELLTGHQPRFVDEVAGNSLQLRQPTTKVEPLGVELAALMHHIEGAQAPFREPGAPHPIAPVRRHIVVDEVTLEPICTPLQSKLMEYAKKDAALRRAWLEA